MNSGNGCCKGTEFGKQPGERCSASLDANAGVGGGSALGTSPGRAGIDKLLLERASFNSLSQTLPPAPVLSANIY